jgi:hypothetical protein
VAAVPIASQTKLKKKNCKFSVFSFLLFLYNFQRFFILENKILFRAFPLATYLIISCCISFVLNFQKKYVFLGAAHQVASFEMFSKNWTDLREGRHKNSFTAFGPL